MEEIECEGQCITTRCL